MKYSTLYLQGKKIEIFNSWLGKETIKVNGELKSSKYALFGANHNFQFEDDEGISYDCQINIGMNFTGVFIDVYLDKQPLIVSSVNSSLANFFYFAFTVGLILFFMGVFKNTC